MIKRIITTTKNLIKSFRKRTAEEDFSDLDEMKFIEVLEDISGNDESPSESFILLMADQYFKEKNEINGKHDEDRLLAYTINRLDNACS